MDSSGSNDNTRIVLIVWTTSDLHYNTQTKTVDDLRCL